MEKANLSRRIVSVATAAVMGICVFGFKDASPVEANSTPDTPMFTTGSRTLVDLNANDGRRDSLTPQAYNWAVTGNEPSATFNGLSFKLLKEGSAGSGIRSVNFKNLTKADGTPTLTMDGVTINDADKGGRIKLEITGLSNGTHTITTWHSYPDNWPSGSPVTVSVNGTKSGTINVPTRVVNDHEAGIYHTSFTASGKVTVIVEPTDTSKNGAVLNAFEIDGGDPIKGVSQMSPKDGDRQREIKDGLSWKAGTSAQSHDVYIGTNYNSVFNATKSSSEFKGNQTGTKYALDDSYSTLNTYFWRVDTVGSSGTIKGSVQSFQIARLAFPSAEGYGRFARGGRGGRIVEVTNLNDSGAGSLRQAIEVEKGARIVVFRVGGVISLKSKLTVPRDGGDVYVAGQTAPGDGITLINYGFGVMGASDVVIRHVRTRPGDSAGVNVDGMGLTSANYCIIDHCSISWSIDEGFSSRGARNITFQWNIIGEALNNSIHNRGNAHGFAASISGNKGSFHNNLLVHNAGRNWSLAGGMEQDAQTYGGWLDISNNVVYNWRNRTTDGGVRRLNFVGNYYKAGPSSNSDMHIVSIDGNELNTYDMQMGYVAANKMTDFSGKVLLSPSDDAWAKGKAISGKKNSTDADVRSNSSFFPPQVEIKSADEAYTNILENAGARAPKLDYIDSRYIKEVTNTTYTYSGSKDGFKGIIDSQTDVGGYPNSSNFKGGTAPVDADKDGMPDDWEIKHGLNPNDSKDGNLTTLSSDDYTNVEMYLNELAGDTVNFNKEVTIDPLNGTLIKSLDRLDKTHYANWSIDTNLNTGDVIYGDRTNTFTSIPEELKGVEWIKLACDSKNMSTDAATFVAGKAISVFVGLDSRVAAFPSWMNGWSDTGQVASASNDVVYQIYQKDFDEGEVVALGSNGSPSGVVMYTVFVAEQGSISFNPDEIGDVNQDGIVDTKDFSMLKNYILGKTKTLTSPEDADLDGDGFITSIDLALLNKKILG